MADSTVFAIDAGNTHSGWAVVSNLDGEYQLGVFGKWENKALLEEIRKYNDFDFAIEYPYPRNSTVPLQVFEMAEWVGRFAHVLEECGNRFHRIYRHREKAVMCHSGVATDSQIRASVISVLGGQGTAQNPGPTYGVTGDVWQAIAIGMTFLEEGDSRFVEKRKPRGTMSPGPLLPLP